MRTLDLFNWMKERHAIYERRQQGLPKPWTTDPILLNYRFCNVYRELDTVTQWIKTNWRDPNTNDPDVWFAMAVARYVNWPDTLAEIGYPVPWDAEHFRSVMHQRMQSGKKVFTGAYVIPISSSTSPFPPSKSKTDFLADRIFGSLWAWREMIRTKTASCAIFNKYLTGFYGVGSFMAGQIVCDTKYTRLMDTSLDWWEFATPGPGSRRGLARVFDKPVNYNWEDEEWFVALSALRSAIGPYVLSSRMPPIHAQDLQNCLCEFDKYERVRLGQGKPRSKYPGA